MQASIADVETPIAPELLQRVVADAPAAFGFETSPVVKGSWRLRNPYSTVFRLELGWGSESRFVFVKVPPHDMSNQQVLAGRLATEYHVLRDFAGTLDGAPLVDVVTPLAYYPEHLAIVTVQADGVTLRKLYSTHARTWSLADATPLVSSVRLCARWLRSFHEATSKGSSAFDADDLVEYCRVRLVRLEHEPALTLAHADAERVLGRLREVATRTSPHDNVVAGRHNDFASHNVVVGPSGVRVLDFSMYDEGAVVFDVCNFWLELEMLKLDPTYSRRRLEALQHAFLESYGEVRPADLLFSAVSCRFVLNRLLTSLDDAHGFGPNAWYRRRVAAHCLRWLLAFAQGARLSPADP